MRFRSTGVSALNIEEYLAKIKENESTYLEESTLAHMSLISLVENNNINDEYDLLGHQSNYKMKKYSKFRKKRKRITSAQYFRKKIFFRHKRNRINSESNNSKINLLED